MLEAQLRAREVSARLRNPAGGILSSELEIATEPVMRRRRLDFARDREAEIKREREIDRQLALIAAIEAKEAERILATQDATPSDESAPKVAPKFSVIMQVVCDRFGVTMLDLISSRRTQDVVRPRQIVMYIARHFTTMSLPQIAQRLGGRDHTTAMSGVGKIKRLLDAGDERLTAEIAGVKQMLRIA